MGLKITAGYQAVDNVHKVPHSGVDVAIPTGTPLLSVGTGVVEKLVNYGDTNIGNGVFVRLIDGTQVVYGHLSKVSVVKGQPVIKGTEIGLSGGQPGTPGAGHSTGPHLHLQAYQGDKLIDPTRYLESAVQTSQPTAGGPDAITGVAIGVLFLVLILVVGGKKMIITPVSVIVMVVLAVFFGPAIWTKLGFLFAGGYLDVPLMVGTIVCIWLLQFGAKWPKKYIAWGWLLFWALRGFVFV